MALDILIVDDERDICELVAGVMEDEGYEARTASDSDAALDAIRQRRPSLALIDVWLQGSRLDGLGLVEAIKAFDPTLPIIVISGHGGLDTAVAAIRRGAFDFIEKPFEAERLLHLVARATENERAADLHVAGGGVLPCRRPQRARHRAREGTQRKGSDVRFVARVGGDRVG